MAINVLRGLRHRGASPTVDPDDSASEMPTAISDAPPRGPRVACPTCGRSLGLTQTRCPGCGLRILAGVPLKHGALLIVSGTAIGLIVGGGLAVLIALAGRTTPAQVGQVPVASNAAIVAPSESIDPALISGPVPAGAASSLRLNVTIADRLTASAATLRSEYRAKSFNTSAAITTIRQIAADATWGSDVVDRLGGWPAADPIRTQLKAFYGQIRQTAHDALTISVNDGAKYKSYAKRMLSLLASVANNRKSLAALAAANGISIPIVLVAPKPVASPAP